MHGQPPNIEVTVVNHHRELVQELETKDMQTVARKFNSHCSHKYDRTGKFTCLFEITEHLPDRVDGRQPIEYESRGA